MITPAHMEKLIRASQEIVTGGLNISDIRGLNYNGSRIAVGQLINTVVEYYLKFESEAAIEGYLLEKAQESPE